MSNDFKRLYLAENLNIYEPTTTQSGVVGVPENASVDLAAWIEKAIKDGDIDIPEAITNSADKHYRHNQSTPSTVWLIPHNLNKHPTIEITDSGGTKVIGDIRYDSINHATAYFNSAFSGYANCN